MCASWATSSRRRPGVRRGPAAGRPTVAGVRRSRCSRRNRPRSRLSSLRGWRRAAGSARYRQGLSAIRASAHGGVMTHSGMLSGKIALIMGASRGIGAAAARLFAREGATVVLASRTESALKTLAADIPGASSVVADLGDVADIDRAVSTVLERHGRLDIAFNNGPLNVP